jgi:hypothetical protein
MDSILVSWVDHKRLNDFPRPGLFFPTGVPAWHRLDWVDAPKVSFSPPLPSVRTEEETRLYEPLDGVLRALPHLAGEIQDLQEDLGKYDQKVRELQLSLSCELGNEKAVITSFKKPWRFLQRSRCWSLTTPTRKGTCRIKISPLESGWGWEIFTEEALLKSGPAKTAHEAMNLSLNHLP